MKSVVHIALASLAALSTVNAHGYVSEPPSRQGWCFRRANTAFGNACGNVQYEPQSVEAPSGAPFGRDVGEHVCSGGVPNRPDLNGVDKPSIDWPKTNITKGQDIQIDWLLHAAHMTRVWHFYATKPGFVYPKDRGLTKDDFEEVPVLSIQHTGANPPPMEYTQSLPGSILGDRTGDVVLLAVWEIGDTTNSFYNCIDLNVQTGHDHGSQPSTPSVPFPNYSGSFELECTFKPKQQSQHQYGQQSFQPSVPIKWYIPPTRRHWMH